ncbi:MAG: DUF7064 domain-containing protein [Pseudomonadota bacterium]|jgi:hypothetical protein
MQGFRLEAADEYSHQPTAEPNFNESVYTNGWDPRQRLGAWMRLGNRVNEGHAELSVCVYLPDGRVACQFRRPAIDTNERHAAGGLEYRVLEPFRAVEMCYRGELMVLDDPQLLRDPARLFKEAPRAPGAVEFRHDGVSPLHGGEPVAPGQETMYGRDFSLGHFNQHTRVRGRIQVGGESWDIDGCGWRDHSWGPRYWQNIHFYRLFIANFGADRGFMLLKRTDRQLRVHRVGVLQFDGDYEDIIDLDVITEWDERKDPVRVRLGVRTARRAVRISGEVLTMAPLRNRRRVGDRELACRIAEGFTHWRWEDEREGLGMTEYIEFLEDGEPAGYPL